jgi:hypothetical protein
MDLKLFYAFPYRYIDVARSSVEMDCVPPYNNMCVWEMDEFVRKQIKAMDAFIAPYVKNKNVM